MKKLTTLALSLACAVTCTLGLAACDNANTDTTPDGVTATSIMAEEVSLIRNVSGWKLSDTDEEGKIDRHCIDLYIYVSKNPGTNDALRFQNTDFTVNGVSPDSVNTVGDKKILDNSYTFQDYMSDHLNPYSVKATSTENETETEYTYTSKADYHKITGDELSVYNHFIQRYVLQFENPVAAAQIKFNGHTINVRDEHDAFPSNAYEIQGYAVQMFVADNTSYQVTYGTITQHYAPYQKQHTLSETVITLSGVNLKKYSVQSWDSKDFSIKVGEDTFKAKGFYRGKENSSSLLSLSDLGDEYKDFKGNKLKCTGEVLKTGTALGRDEAVNFSLYFEELETAPQSFTVYYKTDEIVVA